VTESINDPGRTESAPPSVSVVLPTYNRADTLKRSIQSVLSQSFADFELIIVDDASTDDTESVVLGFEDSRIVFVRKSRKEGAAAARNDGLAVARGAYVAFQDSDDVWKTNKIERQLADLRASSASVGVSVCSYVHHHGNNVNVMRHRRREMKGSDVIEFLLKGGSIGTLTLVCRADLVRNIGGFDRSLPRRQDLDLCLRLASVSNFVFSEEPLVDVYASSDSISANPAAFLQATEILLTKHCGLFEVMPACAARQYAKAARHFLVVGDRRQSMRSAWCSILWRINVRALVIMFFSVLPPHAAKWCLERNS